MAKRSIEPEYNQMCIVYNSLKECLIPHINKVKPMSIIQIDRILSQAQQIAYNIGQRAFNVSKIISKKEKEILKAKDTKVFDVLYSKGWKKIDNLTYRRIVFLDSASLFDKKLIGISNFTKKGGKTSVISSKANYDIFPEAFKILNEILVNHINHTEHLSYYRIHCITTVIEYVLNMLKDAAYVVYCSFSDIKMHYLDELEYFVQEPNRQEAITETYKILLKQKPSFMLHMGWKAERVKHLQSLFPSDEPHDEAWFVENGYMYNEDY